MFRMETRYILSSILLILWAILTIGLVHYSLKSVRLEEMSDSLRDRMRNLEIELNEVLIGSIDEFEMRRNKIGSKSDDIGTISLTESGKENIFIETFSINHGNTNDPLASMQFFKIPGRIGNSELYKYVTRLTDDKRKRILVTGGAGFVGSHLVDNLMLDGHEVIVCDNFVTGRKTNVDHWIGHSNFELLDHDVVNPLTVEVDEIYHLASPASPVHYMANPIKTIKTNTIGTINMLGLAKRVGAKILIASTSEVYGDPQIHPQHESYWGHVNPLGPRSCYDEGKRLSESVAVAYKSREGVPIRIARIFNTYGPRMHPNDGRVVSNFIIQCLKNDLMTVYGNGKQTRSFQYVTDLVSGLKSLMASNVSEPVNLGNPNEITITTLASQIKSLLPKSVSLPSYGRPLTDDPHQRRPDIERAKKYLGWLPKVDMPSGLKRTIEYFRQELGYTE